MKQLNKLCLLIFCFILFLSSCNRKQIPTPVTNSFHFYPRECTQIYTAPMQLENIPETDLFVLEKIESGSVASNDFAIWMMTGADDLFKVVQGYPNVKPTDLMHYYNFYPKEELILAPPIQMLEMELRRDYTYRGGTPQFEVPGLDYTSILKVDYRVTGITDLQITALSPLFGQPVGTPLNPYFSILEFNPMQIISFETKHLLFGLENNEWEITDIKEWLALKPMAPPAISFRLKSIPEEVPSDVKFVTKIETTDGKILRDTIQIKLT